MTKKRTSKPAAKPSEPTFPIVVETFSAPRRHDIDRSWAQRPSCFNGFVEVVKYRITIEKVDEPLDVIRDRLVTLWRSSERNWHHCDPMRSAAVRLLGITGDEARQLLKDDEHGVDFVRRGAFTP